MLVQLDLFNEMSEIEMLEEKFRLLQNCTEKVRKSLFAKHGALCKQYLELNERFEVLERILCKCNFGGFE